MSELRFIAAVVLQLGAQGECVSLSCTFAFARLNKNFFPKYFTNVDIFRILLIVIH